jgi:hypothetical protein
LNQLTPSSRPINRISRKKSGEVRQRFQHSLRPHHRRRWLVRCTSEVLGGWTRTREQRLLDQYEDPQCDLPLLHHTGEWATEMTTTCSERPLTANKTYVDQGNAGTADRPNNSSVELRDFTFANITGDINSFNPGDGSCRTNVRYQKPGFHDLTSLLTTLSQTALLVRPRPSQPHANRSSHHRVQHQQVLQRLRDLWHQHLSSESGSSQRDLLQRWRRAESCFGFRVCEWDVCASVRGSWCHN